MSWVLGVETLPESGESWCTARMRRMHAVSEARTAYNFGGFTDVRRNSRRVCVDGAFLTFSMAWSITLKNGFNRFKIYIE